MSQREISRSEVEERRALMRPQELKAMGPDREVFLFEGIPHPVQCDKIKLIGLINTLGRRHSTLWIYVTTTF